MQRRLPCLLLLLTATIMMYSQVDKKSTAETKALYQSFFKLSKQGTMIGHQDAMAYGLLPDHSRWVGHINTSDIKTITGEHPAVIGHDLGHLEIDKDKNLDDVPFDQMRKTIKQVYANGCINTISWHPNNPIDLSKNTWDKVERTIPRILESKKQTKDYKKILSRLASFFKSLTGNDGELIPVIFRPYHEHTGSWFWWGAAHCSPEEYKTFWKLTVDYLVKKKKVHNLIFAYSTDNFKDEAHYLERYPGDVYVDIIGFDTYHRNAPASDSLFIANTKRMVSIIKKLGTEKNKPFAITETGLEKVTESDWWTRILYPIIENTQLSYVLMWRNGRPDHFYVPYKGHASEEDFIRFYNLPGTLFEKDIQSIYK